VFIGLITFWLVTDIIDLDVSNNDSKVIVEKEINPKLILQQRYARGEINSLEYLERMIRL